MNPANHNADSAAESKVAESATEQDAKILELHETLRRVLQRYKDLSFMETPEWAFEEELPVRKANEILRDKYSASVYEEFYLLRRLARSARRLRKYQRMYEKLISEGRPARSSVSEDYDLTDYDLTMSDLEERIEKWAGRVDDLLQEFSDLKSNQ